VAPQALAEPGGICVSQSVRDAVRERLGFAFEDMGNQALRNMAQPVHSYRVRLGGDLPAPATALTRFPLKVSA
jgi:class 3 adenylate cyclase